MQNPLDDELVKEAELAALVAATEGLQPWRRAFHAMNGLILALAPMALGLDRIQTVAILGVALAIQIGMEVVRFRSPRLQALFFRVGRALASPREAEGIASSTWYTLGALLAYAIFPAGIASAAILVLGLADPAASVVGRLWGRRSFGKGSVEGSVAFFVTAMGILLMVVDWPAALAAAIAATLSEVVPGLGDDNLMIPLVTGGVLWFMLSVVV